MSHIVVYQTDDGSSGFEQCGSLDDAIVVAERMRNVDGVEAPRIFRMEEVHIDFRPYYRVEVAESGSDAGTGTIDGEAGASGLDDLPEPPSPEAVAEAEAETGAPMSTDDPTWAGDQETGGDDDAGGDSQTPEAAAHDAEPVAPADETGVEGQTEGGHDADIEEPVEGEDAGDDAMISVRRGLFGR